MGVVAAVFVAAAAVVQMRQVKFVQPQIVHQLQQGREVLVVVLRQRKADAHFNAFVQTQTDAAHRRIERTLLPPELIVCVFDAVQADTDVLVLHVGYLVDVVFRDFGAVAG